MKKAEMNTKSTVIIVAIVAVVLLAAIARFGGLYAIGDPVGSSSVTVKIYDTSGSTSTKTWTTIKYNECTADIPNFNTYTANMRVDSSGKDCAVGQACVGNTYLVSQTVYGTTLGSGSITTNKPRQHPTCVQEITNFAKSAGVNITQVVYLNDTVTETIVNNVVKYTCGDGVVVDTVSGCIGHDRVQTIYVNQTIYMCDGVPSLDPKDCVSSVPVAGEESVIARLLEWIKGIFRA
jgi:hypothetical protein